MPLTVSRLTPRGGTALALGKLTILVGPNNSGKSQTLRDIRDYVVSGSLGGLTIIKDIDVDLPTESEARMGLSLLPHTTSPGHVRIHGVANDLQSRHEFAPQESWINQHFTLVQSAVQMQRAQAREQLLRNMGQLWCASLNAESRFKLAAPVESYDSRSEAPSNALQEFFSGGKATLQELRNAFKEAFGMDIALDWAGMRRFYLKVAPDFGEIPDTLTELDALMRNAQELSQQGDGYKSFAGVALAMLAFSNRVLLLDEPEAFLHPAQARALGRWVANQSKKRSAQTIVASHSADFLLGIISANPSATVVRLNRHSDGTAFHTVPPATTSGLIQSPLLSSQPVLDSLFHRGVAVCEGDPDRAIYQTVLHQFLRSHGGEDVLLIHSNGKDAVKTPVEMLRSAGTPVCAIVDIDILNSSKILTDIIVALTGMPPISRILELREKISTAVEQVTEQQLLELLKSSVQQWLQTEHPDLRHARKALVSSARIRSRWEDVKSKGVDFFQGEERIAVDELLGLLSEIGLFVVHRGELEGWMQVGMSKGKRWSRLALERLHTGQCPPDLENFMRSIAKFLNSM